MPRQKVQSKINKTLFKAVEKSNIDGFQFLPYLLVDNDSTCTRGGKECSTVEFLKDSAWFNRSFFEVTEKEPVAKHSKEQKNAPDYTENELRKFAREQDVDISECKTIEEMYITVFGGTLSK